MTGRCVFLRPFEENTEFYLPEYLGLGALCARHDFLFLSPLKFWHLTTCWIARLAEQRNLANGWESYI